MNPTTAEVVHAFHNGTEDFKTYCGNPVSYTVGIVVLGVIDSEGLQEKFPLYNLLKLLPPIVFSRENADTLPDILEGVEIEDNLQAQYRLATTWGK